jgi:hypothetical protein
MAGKSLALTTLLFMLTACRQQQLSLPVTHAAMSQESNPGAQRSTEGVYQPPPSQSCYSYILLRPKDQRATAVQARLRKADRLAAAFSARKVAVDLLGDHANVLSLTFPVIWPVQEAYSDGISTVVEEYFASPEVQDYMCNSGFAEVRLSLRGQNDRRIHPIWTARVTSEGLVRDSAADQVSDVQLAVR